MNPLSDVEGSGVRFFNTQYRQKGARPVVHTPMFEGCLWRFQQFDDAALLASSRFTSELLIVGRCAAANASRSRDSRNWVIGDNQKERVNVPFRKS